MPSRSIARLALAFTLLAAAVVTARDVPANLQRFVADIRARGRCRNVLAGGFHSSDGDSGDFEYCGDHLKDFNVVYLQGRNGQLVNMDIDCDGLQGGPADDGRCGRSRDTQPQTAFRDLVRSYRAGPRDLDSKIHPFVVFGNDGSKAGWRKFDPRKYGIEPLSVMAVVCGDQLIYGVWGDTNGDDGNEPMVGEASLSLATACFGRQGIDGNSGHDENDVLYLAFPGKDAVPGADGAAWKARDHDAFEASIARLGDRLVRRVGGGRGGGHPYPGWGRDWNRDWDWDRERDGNDWGWGRDGVCPSW